MLDIRPPGETDREAIALLSGLAFNSPPRPERVSLAGRLCVYNGARLTASAGAIDFDQWFGGARVPCAGIEGVVVQPEDRGRGTAGALVAELLRKVRGEGRLVSALYPSTASLYRKLGYEFGGLRPHFRVAITDLPATGLPTSDAGKGEVSELATGELAIGELATGELATRELENRVLSADGLGALADCFSRFASAHNGPVENRDPAWWADRALAHKGEGTYQRTVVVTDDGGVTGYASYFLEERKQDAYALVCKHLVATSPAALNCLIRYFRRFENAAKELVWTGPASAGPLGLALQGNGFAVAPALSRWMVRVLDVPRALECRGYPNIEGEAVLNIDDPLFPDNNGPWHLRAARGKIEVARKDAKPASALDALPIGLFSALFTGLATASDLVLLGALKEDDEQTGFLSELFAGPVPWMPDTF
jgi:predicted acetyltransferase